MKCDLCNGIGRFDDIECMRCGGKGTIGELVQLPLFVMERRVFSVTPLVENSPRKIRIVDSPLQYPDPLVW